MSTGEPGPGGSLTHAQALEKWDQARQAVGEALGVMASVVALDQGAGLVLAPIASFVRGATRVVSDSVFAATSPADWEVSSRLEHDERYWAQVSDHARGQQAELAAMARRLTGGAAAVPGGGAWSGEAGSSYLATVTDQADKWSAAAISGEKTAAHLRDVRAFSQKLLWIWTAIALLFGAGSVRLVAMIRWYDRAKKEVRDLETKAKEELQKALAADRTGQVHLAALHHQRQAEYFAVARERDRRADEWISLAPAKYPAYFAAVGLAGYLASWVDALANANARFSSDVLAMTASTLWNGRTQTREA